MYNKIINIIEHLRRIFILQILFYNHHRCLHVVSNVKLKWKTPFYRFCSTYNICLKQVSFSSNFGLLMWTFFLMCLKSMPFLLLEFRGFCGAVPHL